MAAPYLAAVRAMARFIRASLCCPAAGGQDQSRGMWVTPSLWLVVWKCVGTDMSHLSLSLCISAMAALATQGAHLKPQWPFGLSVGPPTAPPRPSPALGWGAASLEKGRECGDKEQTHQSFKIYPECRGRSWRTCFLTVCFLFFLPFCVTRDSVLILPLEHAQLVYIIVYCFPLNTHFFTQFFTKLKQNKNHTHNLHFKPSKFIVWSLKTITIPSW